MGCFDRGALARRSMDAVLALSARTARTVPMKAIQKVRRRGACGCNSQRRAGLSTRMLRSCRALWTWRLFASENSGALFEMRADAFFVILGRFKRSPQLLVQGDRVIQVHVGADIDHLFDARTLATILAFGVAISIYGLVTHNVERQLAMADGVIPEAVRAIIASQLAEIARWPRGSLCFAAGACFLFGLGSAYAAVRTLMISLNVVYEAPEKRGFVRLHASALLLTLSGIFGVIMDFALLTALPAFLHLLGLPRGFETVLSLLRWPLLAVVVTYGVAMLYRFAPSREQPRWRWVSWGATGAAALWLIGSLPFTWYVAHFGEYNETYGVLGAAVIVLMWSWLGIYAVLLGAAFNAEMERIAEQRRDVPFL
jgi:membrane protein